MNQQSVGIIGVGVLGGVVRRYFEAQGATTKLYDKYQQIGSPDEVNEAPIIFICVPTPYKPGRGFNVGAVESSLAALGGSKTIMIKSTLQPGTTERLQRQFPQHRIFFQPEFLREKTAWEDFIKPDRQIVGYCNGNVEEAEQLLGLLPDAPYTAVMQATAAELVKISTNAFLAMKVVFANQIFDLCEALGLSYEEVKPGLLADPRLGGSHLEVFDSGYRGYGGKCLPKDTLGLIDLAASVGSPVELLETVHEVNERLVQAGSRPRLARLAS